MSRAVVGIAFRYTLPASFSYSVIWRYSSAIHLSTYTSAFQWTFFLGNVYSSIRSEILFVEYPYYLTIPLSFLKTHVPSVEQKLKRPEIF